MKINSTYMLAADSLVDGRKVIDLQYFIIGVFDGRLLH